MPEQNQSTAGVVELVDAGVPADQGLSSLGLLMQLAGNLFAAIATLVAFTMMLTARSGTGDKLWVFLVLGLCVWRSLAHRTAGSQLLYGTLDREGVAIGPLACLKRYIVIGLAQSAVVVGVLIARSAPATLSIAIGLGLATWPTVLAVLLQLPRFKRFANEVPVSEDKGFEAAAILMTVLGACGVLGTGAFLFVMFDAGGRALQHGPGVLLMIAGVMLVIRSGLHVQAGLSGLRETSVDRSVELANRYANFGMISAFCAGGAMLLMLMAASPELGGLVLVSGLVWMLMSWPLIVRRFFSERQFADLLAGDNASLHRRAPDAGLTGVGWLLLGHAALGATLMIPQLVLGDASRGDMPELLATLGTASSHSHWWAVGLILLEGWAGFELLRMRAHHRLIATAYGVVSSALTIYMTWPILEQLGQLGRQGMRGTVLFIPLAIQLVIPVATLALVNRSIAPTARARFRTRPDAQPPTA